MQVVLPLLANEVVTTGWVSESDFLTGFALVQAMPGPLFNFAAYLGAHCRLPKTLPWARVECASRSKPRVCFTCLPECAVSSACCKLSH